jgi:hypothetical protein
MTASTVDKTHDAYLKTAYQPLLTVTTVWQLPGDLYMMGIVTISKQNMNWQ